MIIVKLQPAQLFDHNRNAELCSFSTLNTLENLHIMFKHNSIQFIFSTQEVFIPSSKMSIIFFFFWGKEQSWQLFFLQELTGDCAPEQEGWGKAAEGPMVSYQDDHGPKKQLPKSAWKNCAHSAVQQWHSSVTYQLPTATRKVVTDSSQSCQMTKRAAARHCILGSLSWTSAETCSTGTGYPRTLILHLQWLSRHNQANLQLTWSNADSSAEEGWLEAHLQRPFQSSTSDSKASSLLRCFPGWKVSLAHAAKENWKNWLSSQLSCTFMLSVGPSNISHAHTAISMYTAIKIFKHE